MRKNNPIRKIVKGIFLCCFTILVAGKIQSQTFSQFYVNVAPSFQAGSGNTTVINDSIWNATVLLTIDSVVSLSSLNKIYLKYGTAQDSSDIAFDVYSFQQQGNTFTISDINNNVITTSQTRVFSFRKTFTKTKAKQIKYVTTYSSDQSNNLSTKQYDKVN
jgi:hypothetical protein